MASSGVDHGGVVFILRRKIQIHHKEHKEHKRRQLQVFLNDLNASPCWQCRVTRRLLRNSISLRGFLSASFVISAVHFSFSGLFHHDLKHRTIFEALPPLSIPYTSRLVGKIGRTGLSFCASCRKEFDKCQWLRLPETGRPRLSPRETFLPIPASPGCSLRRGVFGWRQIPCGSRGWGEWWRGRGNRWGF